MAKKVVMPAMISVLTLCTAESNPNNFLSMTINVLIR